MEDFTYSVVSCLMSSLKDCALTDFIPRIAKPFGILGCDPAVHASVSLQHHSPHYLQISNYIAPERLAWNMSYQIA